MPLAFPVSQQFCPPSDTQPHELLKLSAAQVAAAPAIEAKAKIKANATLNFTVKNTASNLKNH